MKYMFACIIIAILLGDQVNAWRRRRRRRARNCSLSSWSSWSRCTHQCGNAGTQYRTRYKTVSECCGGRCFPLREERSCNRNACKNGGSPLHGRCSCRGGYTGTCCEKDICTTKPCQHICTNVGDTYQCKCYPCYTKVGSKCELRQCIIGRKCYQYGTVNPKNQCQQCQRGREIQWTNNNVLSCNDSQACTKNDRCVAGVCKGIPFTCKSCESCDGKGCKVKLGYCVVDGRCYQTGPLKNPCQIRDAHGESTYYPGFDTDKKSGQQLLHGQ